MAMKLKCSFLFASGPKLEQSFELEDKRLRHMLVCWVFGDVLVHDQHTIAMRYASATRSLVYEIKINLYIGTLLGQLLGMLRLYR